MMLNVSSSRVIASSVSTVGVKGSRQYARGRSLGEDEERNG